LKKTNCLATVPASALASRISHHVASYVVTMASKKYRERNTSDDYFTSLS